MNTDKGCAVLFLTCVILFDIILCIPATVMYLGNNVLLPNWVLEISSIALVINLIGIATGIIIAIIAGIFWAITTLMD